MAKKASTRSKLPPTPVIGTEDGEPVIVELSPPAQAKHHEAAARKTGTSRVGLYVMAVLGLCFLAASAVVFIATMLRGDDNVALIATVLGIFTPVIAALLAAMMRELHAETNSRLTAYLELTARASRAEGVLAERERDR